MNRLPRTVSAAARVTGWLLVPIAGFEAAGAAWCALTGQWLAAAGLALMCAGVCAYVVRWRPLMVSRFNRRRP